MNNPKYAATVGIVILTMVSILAVISAGLLTGCGRNETKPPINRTESVANESFLPPVSHTPRQFTGLRVDPAMKQQGHPEQFRGCVIDPAVIQRQFLEDGQDFRHAAFFRTDLP